MGFGNTDASNVADASADLSTAISTNYQNNLNNIAAQSNQIVSNSCNTDIYAISQSTQAGFSTQGQQDITAIATATQTLQQSITQSATSINLGLLVLLIGIALIIVALGYFVAKSGASAAKIIIPFVVVGGVGIGGYLAYKYLIKKTNPGPNPMTIQYSGGNLPPIKPGATYSVQLTATPTNSTPALVSPLNWSILGTQAQSQMQALGLTLDNTGLLSTPNGQIVPTNINNISWGGNVPTAILLTVYVTDSTTPFANVGTNTWLVPIANENLTINVSPSTIPSIAVGQSYGPVTFSASGGESPYTYSAVFPDGTGSNLSTLGLVLSTAGVLGMQDQGAVVPSSGLNGPINFTIYAVDSSGADNKFPNVGTLQVSIPITGN